MTALETYMKIRIDEQNARQKEWMLHSRIYVYLQNKINNNINIRYILNKIEKILPDAYMQNIDTILIGDFEILKQRDINALFEDGCIYISNEQNDNDEMVRDIVHETAHSLEEIYGYEIYGDDAIKEEFTSKRIILHQILSEYFKDESYVPKLDVFLNIDYDAKFDMYLYDEIGYHKLGTLMGSLFLDVYSVTSFREYYASAFEHFFLDQNFNEIKRICPHLYDKLYNFSDIFEQVNRDFDYGEE